MVKQHGARLAQRPELLRMYAAASVKDRMCWEMLETRTRRLWTNGKPVPPTLVAWWDGRYDGSDYETDPWRQA